MLTSQSSLYHFFIFHSIPANDDANPKYAEIGRRLMQSGTGIVTEHGILFVDEDVQFQELYDGQVFPPYLYDSSILCTAKAEYHGKVEYLYLPCERAAIDKSIGRLGAPDAESVSITATNPVQSFISPSTVASHRANPKTSAPTSNGARRGVPRKATYHSTTKTSSVTARVQTESPKSIPKKPKRSALSTSDSLQAIAYRVSHRSSTTCKSQPLRVKDYGRTQRSNPSSPTRNTRAMPSSTRPTSRTACPKR